MILGEPAFSVQPSHQAPRDDSPFLCFDGGRVLLADTDGGAPAIPTLAQARPLPDGRAAVMLMLRCSVHILTVLVWGLNLLLCLARRYDDLKKRLAREKECARPMKKSCLIAVVAALAAVAGALVAVAVYLRRREKELDEYERLLFGEDEAVPADTEEQTEEPADEAGEDAAE